MPSTSSARPGVRVRPARAGAAHLAAGGALPGPFPLGALAVLTGCAATALAGRTLTPGRALLVLGTGQVLLHAALTQLAAHGGHVLATGHHSVAVVASAPHPSAPPDVASTAAHAVATAACALLLARGDRALALLLTWLRPLRGPAAAVLTVVLVPRVPTAARVVLSTAPGVPARRASRRGPPRGSVPATTTP